MDWRGIRDPVVHKGLEVFAGKDGHGTLQLQTEPDGVGAYRGLVPTAADLEIDPFGRLFETIAAKGPEQPSFGVGHRRHQIALLCKLCN